MSLHELEIAVERFFAAGQAAVGDATAMGTFLSLCAALESGEARAASPDSSAPTGWRVNAWVKRGILLGFRLGALQDSSAGALTFVDKHTYPVRTFTASDAIRVVPGGSSVRAGAFLARSVVCVTRSCTNASRCAFVSPCTRFDDPLPNATKRPSSEIATPPSDSPLPCAPVELTLTRVVVPVSRSCTNMSAWLFVSPGTRFVAWLENAT